ncbi:MAG: PAS domain-containing protein, partial [Pseudobdellovibrionaceae bacterium]|nr:PAS domain-containing protein [Pseudobdellovibrionaceae bacterium]
MLKGKEAFKVIKLRKQEIMDSWVARARSKNTGARSQGQLALIGTLPRIMDEIIEALELEHGKEGLRNNTRSDLTQGFGVPQPQLVSFDPAQIAQKYIILYDTLFETIERAAIVRKRDRRCILEAINVSMQFALDALNHAPAKKENEGKTALKMSGDIYRMMVQEVDEYAVFMINPDGHIASWNKGTFKIKGYQDYEIIGQPFQILFTEEDTAAGQPERELEFAARQGRFEGEGWRRRKDGSRFWANVVLTS